MPYTASKEIKIAICGVGFVGSTLAKLAMDKGLAIVAAYNRAGDKIGKDLGDIANLSHQLNVPIQDIASADFSKCDADIVLIAAGNTLEQNMVAYKGFLSAGINVLCHASESYSPRWANPELAKVIDNLSKEHGVTFCGSGIWDMTRLWSGMIISGPCVKIDSLIHSSSTEIVRQGTHLLGYFGIGKSRQEFEEMFAGGVGPLSFFHIPGALVLEKLGYTVRSHKSWIEPILWDKDFYCPQIDTTIPAQRVVGARVCVDVESENGPSVAARIEYRLFEPNEIEVIRWRVNGSPSSEIRVIREDSGLASASSLFNRIPDVLAARPGIVEVGELGPGFPPML